jgi:hypothetical protein
MRINSDGAVRKDERIRGSWTDHSSYMSGDHYPHSAPRVHKRAIPEDDSPVDESQDALSMLVSPIPNPPVLPQRRMFRLTGPAIV